MSRATELAATMRLVADKEEEAGCENVSSLREAANELERLQGEVERRTDVLNDAIRWLSRYRPVGGRYTIKELEDFDARLDALKVRRSSREDSSDAE